MDNERVVRTRRYIEAASVRTNARTIAQAVLQAISIGTIDTVFQTVSI